MAALHDLVNNARRELPFTAPVLSPESAEASYQISFVVHALAHLCRIAQLITLFNQALSLTKTPVTGIFTGSLHFSKIGKVYYGT